MVAEPGDEGFFDGRTSLVPYNGDPGRLPAMITGKRPDAGNRGNMANWVVYVQCRPHGGC
jgi:hypothetical protein